jgi:hypothetical protein
MIGAVDRLRVWLAISPIVAGGVLAAHALAYRLTGTPTGPLHDYLDHAPQVLLVAALAGLAAGLAARRSTVAAWPFPVAALAAFAAQEHAERLLHTGDVPWIVLTPVFLVGLLLQVPVALAVWLLARWLLRALVVGPARRPRLPRHLLALPAPRALDVRAVPARVLPGRGPPLLRRS